MAFDETLIPDIPERADRAMAAEVVNTVAADGDDLYVKVPGFDDGEGKWLVRWRPLSGGVGSQYPQAGDEVLVEFDDDNNLWVIASDGGYVTPPTGGGGGTEVVPNVYIQQTAPPSSTPKPYIWYQLRADNTLKSIWVEGTPGTSTAQNVYIQQTQPGVSTPKPYVWYKLNADNTLNSVWMVT